MHINGDKTVKFSISLIWVSPKSRFNIPCYKKMIITMLNKINDQLINANKWRYNG